MSSNIRKKLDKLIYKLCYIYQKNEINTIDFIEYVNIVEGKKLPHVLPSLKHKIRNL